MEQSYKHKVSSSSDSCFQKTLFSNTVGLYTNI